MAFSEFEKNRYGRVVAAFIEKRRPPPHIRPELDLGFRLSGQSVEIFEIRSRWKRPSEKLEHGAAKATYVKAQGVWKIFWLRGDLKWHRYGPMPEANSLEQFLTAVDEDPYGCFFG